MIDKTTAKMDNAFKIVFKKFYDKGTHLIYDYLTGEEKSYSKHLPTIEEIGRNYPNPCGWGTGMEDSALNGGSILEGIVAKYEVTKDVSLKAIADDIFDGLYLLGTVSSQKGFLARSVSPVDCKSHYINSSRDQYTHWIWAYLRFYSSSLSDTTQKAKIKDVLISFAEKAEKDVTLDNDLCLTREDGYPAAACEMFDCWGHEVHRLPMIYMGAWVVSGNIRWKQKYEKLRERALCLAERQKEIFKDKKQYEWCYAFLQMQYSLKLLYEYETDIFYKARYEDLIEYIGELMTYYIESS